MVEHRVHIAGVIGSSPIRTTTIRLMRGGFFCGHENHSLGEWFKGNLLAIMQMEKLLLL